MDKQKTNFNFITNENLNLYHHNDYTNRHAQIQNQKMLYQNDNKDFNTQEKLKKQMINSEQNNNMIEQFDTNPSVNNQQYQYPQNPAGYPPQNKNIVVLHHYPYNPNFNRNFNQNPYNNPMHNQYQNSRQFQYQTSLPNQQTPQNQYYHQNTNFNHNNIPTIENHQYGSNNLETEDKK